MPVVNATYFTRLFWDGRASSLEDQSQHPFVNPVEPMREMINWCIRKPLEGKGLATDGPRMVALEACIVQERRGIKLDPGRH